MDLAQLAHEITWLKNNFKQYVAGQTYNGVSLNITGANFTCNFGKFIPQRMVSGENVLYGNIVGTFNPAGNSKTLTVTGIDITNIDWGNDLYQAGIRGYATETGVSGRNLHTIQGCYGGIGTAIFLQADGNFNHFGFSFINILNSWPTWADSLT